MTQSTLDLRTLRGMTIALTCALVVAGCSVRPKPIDSDQVRKRVDQDQRDLYAGQEPITRPLGFHEALARAYKYNLDFKLKQMESALALNLQDVSRYEMLPRLLVSAGYVTRNNDSGGTSVGIVTGQESLIPSYTVDRTHVITGAEFSWNALDFGLSYLRAKQLADQYLIAEERRRRVMHNILQDVRSAYWRALGAQRLAGQAERQLQRVSAALERSRQAEAQGLLPPAQVLGYQRALLDAATLLNVRRQELEFSRSELAALMSVPPGTPFTLVDEPEAPLPPVPGKVAELENMALAVRPELREEDYRKRISGDETRRQLLALMPNLGLNVGPQYDNNSLLYNQSWIEGGLRLSLNLLRLAALPSTRRAGEQAIKTDDARRLALSMAVLTQLRVAVERYALARSDLQVAQESSRVDQKLAEYARAAATSRVDTELEVIRTEARALVTQFYRHAAYANAQTAYGRIYNSLGLDPLPGDIGQDSVDQLAARIRRHLDESARIAFPSAASVPDALPPLRVAFDGAGSAEPGQAIRGEAIQGTVRKTLERSGFRLVDSAASGAPDVWTLALTVDLGPVRNGVRRGEWQVNLLGPGGQRAGSSVYGSALGASPSEASLIAFAEAATVSQVGNLRQWMAPAPGSGHVTP
jgi:outer membrane protein TolC